MKLRISKLRSIVFTVINEKLEALRRLCSLVIQPHTTAIPLERIAPGQHAICSCLDIQVWPNPLETVFAIGISRSIKPAGLVPNFVQVVFGIIENAILEGTRHRAIPVVHFEQSFRLEWDCFHKRGVYERYGGERFRRSESHLQIIDGLTRFELCYEKLPGALSALRPHHPPELLSGLCAISRAVSCIQIVW